MATKDKIVACQANGTRHHEINMCFSDRRPVSCRNSRSMQRQKSHVMITLNLVKSPQVEGATARTDIL